MLHAAQLAEDNFPMTTRIRREAVGLYQAFLTTSPGGGGLSNPIVGAYPSQAKDTIRRYAPGSGHSTDGSANTHGGDRRGWCPFACHGCGGPHPWTEFKNGEHIVICPNRDNPGVRKNAKRNIDRMKVYRQKRHRENTKWKNLGTANYSNFDSAGQEHIKQQVLLSLKHGTHDVSNTASVALSVTTPSSVLPATNGGLSRGAPGGRVLGGSCIFIIDVPVLASQPDLKPMMPIAIHQPAAYRHAVWNDHRLSKQPVCSLCCRFVRCSLHWELPLLHVFGKTLSALFCEGLCSPGLCANRSIRRHPVPSAQSRHHRVGASNSTFPTRPRLGKKHRS
jgi:hypothetical protein